jgi:hypothetical protein
MFIYVELYLYVPCFPSLPPPPHGLVKARTSQCLIRLLQPWNINGTRRHAYRPASHASFAVNPSSSDAAPRSRGAGPGRGRSGLGPPAARVSARAGTGMGAAAGAWASAATTGGHCYHCYSIYCYTM